MPKMTFKQFLTEVDVGDLQLARQHREKEAAQAEEQRAAGAFKEKMGTDSPNQGDIIQTQSGKFMVAGMNMKGIHLKELGGERTAILPHGSKFKATDKNTQAGRSIFNLVQ